MANMAIFATLLDLCVFWTGAVVDVLGQVASVFRTVLFCTVVSCAVVYCTVLQCIVLYFPVLYCTELYLQTHASPHSDIRHMCMAACSLCFFFEVRSTRVPQALRSESRRRPLRSESRGPHGRRGFLPFMRGARAKPS